MQQRACGQTEEPQVFPGPGDWVCGQNATIRRIAQHVRRVAKVQCTVLISGETGTGKEVWAGLIHKSGPRASKPFLPVNCAALSLSLTESQLFGHEKGAFTGATGSSLGILRAANGGVVFLDEIGELPIELQPKLLRALQQGEVHPIGASRPVPIDVQVIAATNRNLDVEVAEGRFREDLYYRLNMVHLRVPPLRERPEDIPAFIDFFSSRCAKRYERPVWRPDPETLRRFCEASWPGNIRQLSHVIEQSYVLDCAPALPEDKPDSQPARTVPRTREIASGMPSMAPRQAPSLPHLNLAKLRDEAVRQALRMTGGHKGRAAELLGIHANTLTRLLVTLEHAHQASDAEPIESRISVA